MFFNGSGVSGAADFLGVDFLWATLEPSVTWTACGLSLRIRAVFFMVYVGLFSEERTESANPMGSVLCCPLDWQVVSKHSQVPTVVGQSPPV